MNEPYNGAGGASLLAAALADARATARQTVERILEERFDELETRVLAAFEEAVSDRVRSQVDEIAGLAKRHTTDRLNGAVRRLQGAESPEIWTATLLDAAAEFCSAVALIRVAGQGSTLRLQGSRGGPYALPDGLEIPAVSAPAILSAVEGKETVVAAGSAEELSTPIASALAAGSVSRVYLFPVVVRGKALAVLYAHAGATPVDVSALELLTSMAGYSMKAEAGEVKAPEQSGSPLIRITGQIDVPEKQASPRPAWTALPKAEQEIHLRAQRFARTTASELLLHKVQQVRAGRASNNLYDSLREEIDTARGVFREQYMAVSPTMVDYLHLELVRTLAKENEADLGSSYPGPLP